MSYMYVLDQNTNMTFIPSCTPQIVLKCVESIAHLVGRRELTLPS